MKKINSVLSIVCIFLIYACATSPNKNATLINRQPKISPDYLEITIPINIAPLNFSVEEEGDSYFVKVLANDGSSISARSKNGIIKFPKKKWKNLLANTKNLEYQVFVKNEGEWKQFESFSNWVSDSPVDPYLYYRLLYPGYESWKEISIMQRSLESFDERAVVKNDVVDQNCVNCHSFNQQNPKNFMFHMRGSMGGTYFVTDGDLTKFNLKTKEMENGAVYPRWHPSGNFVAFSSNKVVQQFHSMESKKIEVSDLNSSLVLYDVVKNEMMDIKVGNKNLFMDTYPEWSPDGNTLYFCRAAQIGKEYDYRDTKYNLCRASFNQETRLFGEVEVIFDAAAEGKSVSFPRVSPNGNSLVFTYHNYGCFPIWHKEADLYSINLNNLKTVRLNSNSDFTDSYHSWSSNGNWMIFSSKRGDGLTARPYITFMDNDGLAKKPFILPQEDPTFYSRFIKTYNIPEFAQSEVSFSPGTIRDAANKEAVQAKWSKN